MLDARDLRFFLDSGAYSAWSVGKEIDLDEYCEFIRYNIDHLDVYACLDVIPGAPNRAATNKERDEAAAMTWRNYLYMKEAGLDPLPVYHYGEDPRWLHNMLQHGCDYIGLGGLVGVPSALRRAWLDRVFTEITDEAGMPTVKTHGFGMTTIPLLFRYPWFSVDSTTWIKASATGAVYLPRVSDDGEFLFDRAPFVMTVSNISPEDRKVQKARPWETEPGIKELLERWLTLCGTTLPEVSSNYYYRALCNVTFFKMVGEEKKSRPFIHRKASQQRFF